jgi:hypothetical protein
LPADFSGPPAGAVSGNVVSGRAAAAEAARPQLGLQWLGGFGSGAPFLIEQPLSFQRSSGLQSDWDIGLRLPTESAKFETTLDATREATRSVQAGADRVQIAVAKAVYFDDRDEDGRLDRGCRGPLCDEVKAWSAQFVVYVARPIFCPSSAGVRARPVVAAGYHYYAVDERGGVREVDPEAGLSFAAEPPTRGVADPTAELAGFTAALLRSWGRGRLEGC